MWKRKLGSILLREPPLTAAVVEFDWGRKFDLISALPGTGTTLFTECFNWKNTN